MHPCVTIYKYLLEDNILHHIESCRFYLEIEYLFSYSLATYKQTMYYIGLH